MGWTFFAAARCLGAASVATVLFAGAAANAQSTAWGLSGSALQHPGFIEPRDGPGIFETWVSYDLTPTIASNQVSDGLKIYGYGNEDQHEAFRLLGSQYIGSAQADSGLHGNRLIMEGVAEFDASQWSAGKSIETGFEFTLAQTGGLINLNAVYTAFSLFDGGDNFLVGDNSSGAAVFGLASGNHPFSFGYQDSFPANFQSGQYILWSIEIYFDWYQQSESDSLRMTIPQNSIDIQVVPAPSGAGLLGLAGLALLRRRRA